MLTEIIIFLLTSLIAYFVYVHKRIHRKFDKMDVKYLPGWPMFGNLLCSTFRRKHVVEDMDTTYKAFPDERYVGFIEGAASVFLIRDPELIKAITVKDFDHFVDHKEFFSEDIEPLFGASLLMMKGERWHDMRTTLSPAFTGSKMRLMMPFMTEISDNIMEYLKDHQSETIDVDDLVRRYTSDVIASAGFGLQVNSVKDRDNEFYKIGQSMFNFTFLQRTLFFFNGMFPSLAKKMGLHFFPVETTSFFRNLVANTIEYRIKNKVERPDMIQLLMEAKKGTLKSNADNDSAGFATTEETFKPQGHSRNWTDNELTGQVFIFFVAGFESAATAVVMCVHELALNPHVEEKLYQEIKEFKERHGKLTYDNINELKYLDCVLNETLRKWATALILDRVCTKTYILPPPREGGKPVKLQPGDIVYNLVNSLHMDPKYFQDPEVFDPERFSDENKHNIKPFTFMPFGMGPRNCIGSRFALLELKVLLYNLVLNYQILKTNKTIDPLKLQPLEFNIKAKGGTKVKVQARN